MNTKIDRLAFFETIGSVLWFLMDAMWMCEYRFAAYALIPFTVFANLAVFIYIERTIPCVAVTAAMNSWVLMNTFWMVSDFKAVPALLYPTKFFFIAGVLFLAIAFRKSQWRKDAWQEALHRFRRFRVR